MAVDAEGFTPPEIRPETPEWDRYRPPRFSRRVRVALTAGILFVPAFLLVAAGLQLVAGDGQARAAFAFLLFPMVPLTPLLVWAMRDLWGWQR